MTEQKSSSSVLAPASNKSGDFRFRLSLALLLVVLLSVLTQGVGAQQENEARNHNFGIVDMNAVMQQSNAIKVIRQALDEQNALFQEQIHEEELALSNAEKQLNKEKETLSQDEFEIRLADFEERVIRLQRRIQAQRSGFDDSFNEAQEKLQQELVRVVSDIATERGYMVIIQKQNAVIYDSNLDITQLALERLNERTKNLTVTLEKKE